MGIKNIKTDINRINKSCKFNHTIKLKGMSKKMLEYSKEVLMKMSFDVKLFKKELAKAYQNLMEEEVIELRIWVESNFGKQYCLQRVYLK